MAFYGSVLLSARCYNMHKKSLWEIAQKRIAHIEQNSMSIKFNLNEYNMNQQVNVYDINNQQNYSSRKSKQFKIFKSIALDGMDNIW